MQAWRRSRRAVITAVHDDVKQGWTGAFDPLNAYLVA
jgi:hypothetical protein